MIIKLKDLINENEAEHRATLDRTGFWGKRGAGCLIVSKATGKILVPFRSSEVQQPHTWGTLGGAIDENEDPVTAVKREVEEEVGYSGKILKIVPLYVFKKKVEGGGEFHYHNFLVIVENEFEPKLNWETDYCKWVTIDELDSLEPKHFGLRELLRRSSDKIKMEIRQKKLDENRGTEVDVKELYHVTPSSNVSNILTHGLEPRAENKLMIHDKAIYLVSSDIDAWNIAFQLNKALVKNKKVKHATDFTILKIDKNKLPNIKLYKDLQSIHEAGILTYDSIPPDAISVYEKLPADILLGKNYRKFYKFRHFTGERGKPYPTINEVYEDWKGNWIHYSKQPQITINPQQFHSDIAGIYLFPEKFDPMPHWKTYPYKFIVSVPNNMRILDLGKIKEGDWMVLIKKLNLEKQWKESSFYDKKKDSFQRHFSDDMWDFLKNEYSLKPGKWNSDFRKLGYDAIFDDTKSVHIKEDQLIVLDPRIIKVLKMEQRSGSGFEGVKMVTNRILDMLKKRKGFTIKNDPKKDQYGEIKSFIKFSNLPEDKWDDENYRSISFTIETRRHSKQEKTPHIIGVSVSSNPGRSYGVGAQYSTLENDWKDVDDLKKEIDWVLSSKEKYAIAEGYIGNCVSILDDTSCPWNDATEMAYDVEEHGTQISKEEFLKNVKDPHLRMIMSTMKPIEFGKNEDKGIYWILDSKDIHWFFTKDSLNENIKSIQDPIKYISKVNINGTAGDCGLFAISFNKIFLNGKAKYIGAINKRLWELEEYYLGHVALLYGRKFYDYNGEMSKDELEAWGQLDESGSEVDLFNLTAEECYDADLVDLSNLWGNQVESKIEEHTNPSTDLDDMISEMNVQKESLIKK